MSVGGKKGQRYLRSVKRDAIRDPKKPSSPEKTTSSVPSEATSPRVRNDINVPVRRQIAWAKAAKKLMTAAKVIGPKVSRKYKKSTNEQPIIDEDLSNVDFSTIKPPAVFVDGYNIIGYMRTVEGTQMNLEEARDCLISDLAILHGATGWHIEVVFDAYQVKGTQNTEEVSGILVTFPASSETADNYIERRFEELRKEGFTNMVVATNDRMLQSVAGSSGLGYLSASMLLKEMRAAYRGWDEYERKLEEEAEKHVPRLGDMISSDMLTFIKEEMKRENG
eukprot:gene31461-38027_t